MPQIYYQLIQPPNPRGKISTNSQIHLETSDENRNSKVCTIKILLDPHASVSIIRQDILYERHRILKDKKNNWPTLAGTFNITFVTEIILKLLKMNHSAKIYAKYLLMDKLLNYNTILDRDILHKLGIIFNFKI